MHHSCTGWIPFRMMQEYECLLEEKQLLTLDGVDVLEEGQNRVCIHMLMFVYIHELSVSNLMFCKEMCVFFFSARLWCEGKKAFCRD